MLTLASSTLPIIIDPRTYILLQRGCFYGTALGIENLMGNTLLIDYHMQFSLAMNGCQFMDFFPVELMLVLVIYIVDQRRAQSMDGYADPSSHQSHL
jgi:hypothetical protein